MSTFQGIDTASSALAAMQQALNTTGENISNVNTVGYSRQVANLTTNPSTPYWGSLGQTWIGDGVGVADITRIQNTYLSNSLNQNSSSLSQAGAQLSGSQQVQSIFNEPSSSGISSAISTFFNAWSALSSSPNDSAAQLQVQQAGSSLTNKVSGAYANLTNLELQGKTQIQGTISQIQDLAGQVAQINKEIKSLAGGSSAPNSLLDQRDQVLSQLSQLVGINVNTEANGTVNVSVGQIDLVDSAGAHTFPTSFDAATSTVTDGTTTYPITSGQLAGQMASQQTMMSAQSQLDTLANTLRTTVNALVSTGTTTSGATGQNFFLDGPGVTGASQFALDPTIAANSAAIPSGTTGKAGDGGLADQIFQLQSTSQASLGNQTPGSYYNGLVSSIGQQVSGLQTQQTNLGAVSSQLQKQIQSVSGVNMDEEMANMLKYQQSYSAAAKTLSIAHQTLQSLIDMVQ